jgi:hypothetical protein
VLSWYTDWDLTGDYGEYRWTSTSDGLGEKSRGRPSTGNLSRHLAEWNTVGYLLTRVVGTISYTLSKLES